MNANLARTCTSERRHGRIEVGGINIPDPRLDPIGTHVIVNRD